MDRRQLLIVFAMTLSFLFINTYFFSPTPKQALTEEANAHTINIADLPLVDLYQDKEKNHLICQGIKLGDAIATLSSTEKLPKTLFTTQGAVNKLNQNSKDTLALYGETEESRILSKTLDVDSSEVVLLSDFQNKDTLKAISTFSKNHQIEFAQESLPYENALAIAPSAEGWSLIGLWSEESQSLQTPLRMKSIQKAVKFTADSTPLLGIDESFYVLETDEAQFVFSNHGGSLAEVNLKFDDETHPGSVHPTRFDTLFEKGESNNTFPNFPYHALSESGNVVLKDPVKGGYTPLLRRSLKNENHSPISKISSSHYALNLVSKGPVREPLKYKMTEMKKDSISFSAEENGRVITKSFTLLKDVPYTLKMSVKVDGDARDLWITSGVPEVEMISNSHLPTLKYLPFNAKKNKASKLKLPKQSSTVYDQLQSRWTANTNGFFGLITEPALQKGNSMSASLLAGTEVPTRLSVIDPQHNQFPAKDYPGYELLTPYEATPKTLEYYFFAGPLDNNILNKVDGALMNLSSTLEAGFASVASVQGWTSFISEPFAKLLFIVMQGLFMLTHSWGLTIILLTVVLKLALYPLNSWSFKSNAKMQKLAPKVKEIQKKYKDDPKRMQAETAMLYRNEGVSLFSVFLPTLIQIPFLIGMFDLIKSTFALRGVSFISSNWISDLTAPDVVFSWTAPIPLIGTSLHILPIIAFLVMFIQQKMNSKKQQAKGDMTDQQKQMQHVGLMISFGLLFFFYNMASGLNIYFIFSTLLGIVQQIYMTRKIEGKKSGIIKKSN